MPVSIIETSPTVRTLEVSIPQTDVTAAFDKKVNDYRKEVHLKGFRPGMVPKNVIKQRFGEAIRQEVVDQVIQSTVQSELQKASIVPVAQGKMEDFKEEENEISFKLIVEIDPALEVTGYKDLGLKIPEIVIGDVEIQDELNHLQRMYAEQNPVERAAGQGDAVEGRYLEVSVEGEAKPLPENPSFRAVIGESTTPGFDDGLIGVEPGTEKDILFTYPADHKDPAYAGKNAQFKIAVEKVNEVKLPELDDALAQKLGLKTLDELKERVQDSLLHQKKNQAKTQVQEEAIDRLIEQNPFEVAEARIKNYVAHMLHKGQQDDEEHEHQEPTAEQMDAMGPQAIREIKKYRILESIIAQEKLRPKQAQVDARIHEMAQAYGIDFETLKNSLRQSGRVVEIREDVKFSLALDLIVGEAAE